MMVNEGTTTSRRAAVNVTAHEIAHTYFPFYMGTNEEKYAWMDEGWAQYLPTEIQKSLADSNDMLGLEWNLRAAKKIKRAVVWNGGWLAVQDAEIVVTDLAGNDDPHSLGAC